MACTTIFAGRSRSTLCASATDTPCSRFAAICRRSTSTQLARSLAKGDVLFEGNPFVGRALQTHPRLAAVERLSVFMSPLSREELMFLRAPERNVSLAELVTDVMRRKLLRRTRKQKGELGLKDLENIERRAGSAYGELRYACEFSYVLVNHDGEDSDNWNAFPYPLGEARKAVLAFAALLRGELPEGLERWEKELVPGVSNE